MNNASPMTKVRVISQISYYSSEARILRSTKAISLTGSFTAPSEVTEVTGLKNSYATQRCRGCKLSDHSQEFVEHALLNTCQYLQTWKSRIPPVTNILCHSRLTGELNEATGKVLY